MDVSIPAFQTAFSDARFTKSFSKGATFLQPAFNPDRGLEFSTYAFRTRLAGLGITQRMKRPREITDNAFIELFFHSMKSDVIHGLAFDNDRDLQRVVARYFRRYNRIRMHSSIGYRFPIDYENVAA